MVFSFFKKQPQKMPDRPAAKPRPAAANPDSVASKPVTEAVKAQAVYLPDLEFSVGNMPPPKSVDQPTAQPGAKQAPAVAKPADNSDFTDEDFERDFTESSVMAIDVDFGGDPLQADIEQVVVLLSLIHI